MSAARKIELKSAGQEAFLQVHSVALAKVGKYPEVEFIGLDDMNQPAMIAVNQKSADRQLARLSLSYTSASGRILRFSRSASDDPAKPYWNIDDQGEFDTPVTPIGRSGTKETPDFDDDPRMQEPHPADREQHGVSANQKALADASRKDIYHAITKDTLKNILPLYLEAGIECDAAALGAMVATRFIAATR